MRQTKTYGLTAFDAGDFLYPELDKRRFVTLDYHLGTYIGVVGNGVIRGWDIEPLSGLNIRVASGSGFIAGMYSESPYFLDPRTGEPLRKSEAESLGYPIGDEIPGWSSGTGSWAGSFFSEGGTPPENAVVFKQLGPDGEDANYDGIIDGVLAPVYEQPSYSHLADPYVKAYVPASNYLVLQNNSDNYIFAERVSTDPYETFVRLLTFTSFAANSSRVFIAKVVTRYGSVSNINITGSFRLTGMTGNIAELGRELIRNHVHGGSKLTDPPKINLKTDIRKCAPHKSVNGKATFTITPSISTEVAEGHRHEFRANSLGNGYTLSVIGDYGFHYHKIKNFKTTKTVGNYGETSATYHDHNVPQSDTSITGTQFRVWVNGREANSADYTINASDGTITFAKGKANITSNLYSSSFVVRGERVYTFEKEAPNLQYFVIPMISNFLRTYSSEIEGVGVVESTRTLSREWNPELQEFEEEFDVTSSRLEEWGYYLRDPFSCKFIRDGTSVEVDEKGRMHVQNYVPTTEPLSDDTRVSDFSSESGGVTGGRGYRINVQTEINIWGFEDLAPMSVMASNILKKDGDVFVLLPNIAKFIPVELKRAGRADEVVVEILDDVEITGILRNDSIYFVRAEKFTAEKFDQARIPFINHLGRMGEVFYAQASNTITKDGVEFIPSVHKTDTASGHSHRVYVNANGDGVTIATLVNNKIAVWQYNQSGKVVRITHSHTIKNNKVLQTVSTGVNLWSGVDASTNHKHFVDEVVHGSAQAVYAMGEDDSGNLTMCTSNGIVVLPIDKAYLVSVGDREYYSYGLSLLDAVKKAGARYANETGESSNITSAMLDQAVVDEVGMTQVGDTSLLGGDPVISASRKLLAKIDNLYQESAKVVKDIEHDEVKVRKLDEVKVRKLGDDSSEHFLVRRMFDNRVMWQVSVVDGLTVFVSHNGIIYGTQYKWDQASLPSKSGIVRKTAHIGSSYIAATSGGVAISRNNSSAYASLNALASSDCFDIVTVGSRVAIATQSGVYMVSEDGTAELALNTSNCRQLAVDMAFPGGAAVYCVDETGKIWISTDDGSAWTYLADMPQTLGEYGKLYPMFGKVLAATVSGLYLIDGGSLQLVFDNIVRCSTWSSDFSTVKIGGDGFVYSTVDGESFVEVLTFDGIPFPAVNVDNNRKVFGYAHNYLGGVCFEIPPDTSSKVSVSMSFDKWIATEGSWNASAYEFFIDKKRVLSTRPQTAVDLRDSACDNFQVYQQRGEIDFTWRVTLSANAKRGDKILYVNQTASFDRPRSISLLGVYIIFVKEPHTGKTVAQKIYRTIYTLASSASNGVVFLDEKLPTDVDAGSFVRILSTMTADKIVTANLYDSDLESIGILNHYEVDDALSDASVGLPMRISETYVWNLSALAMAVKRAIPAATDSFKGWKSYDMNYECDPSSLNYVGNEFDIEATMAGRQTTFGRDSGNLAASIVRCITFGDGDHEGILFAGTDVGLFMMMITPSMERPWLPVSNCPVKDVYGIVIINGNSVMVAGVGGIYMSDAGTLDTWNLMLDVSENNIPSFLAFRWAGTSGPYWWNSWSGSHNTMSIDLTNAIVAGGNGNVLVTQDDGQTWTSVAIPATASGFAALSDGTSLMGANGGPENNNAILYDIGKGDLWNVAAFLPGMMGNVISRVVNTSGNLSVVLNSGTNYVAMKDGSLTGLLAICGQSTRIVAGNENNTVFLQGSKDVPVGIQVVVRPPNVNAIIETGENSVFVGTSIGMLTDRGSYISQNKHGGIINVLDKQAVVEAIDVNGEIEGVNQESNKTTLTCYLDRAVRQNKLAGLKLFVNQGGLPYVAVLSPLPGSVVASTTLSIITSTIQFEPGASGYIKIVVDTRDPIYSVTNTTSISGLSAGKHKVVVTLTDRSRNELSGGGASKTVYFYTTTSDKAPSIAVSFPSSGQRISSANIDVVGRVLNFDANGGDGYLHYSLDAGTASAVIMRQNGEFSISLKNLTEGSHSIKLSLVGVSGLATGVYVDIPFSIASTDSPYIRIISPSSGATLPVNYTTIQYSITNFSVPSQGVVVVYLDGVQVSTSQSPTSATLVNLPDDDRIHSIKVVLASPGLVPIDSAYGSHSVSFTVSSSAATDPLAVILAPVNNQVFSEGTSVVAIDYDTNNFKIPTDGGVVIASGGTETYVTSASPYSFPTPSNGTYTVTITLATSATAKLTNQTATATVTFVVGSASPKAILSGQTVITATRATPASPRAVIVDSSSSSSSERELAGFSIVSNDTSAANGATNIVVRAVLSSNVKGKTVRIVGGGSTVYFSSSYPIEAGEFAGGTLYVGRGERNNEGKTYSIVSNTQTSATLSVAISPASNESVLDVYVGENIGLVKKSGRSTAWVTFDTFWERNALAREVFAIDHSAGGRSYGIIISNDSRSIEVESIDRASFSPGDRFFMLNPVFSDLLSFSRTETTIDSDHNHETSLVGGSVSGKIASMQFITSSMVEILVSDGIGLDDPLITENPEVLAGTTAVFYANDGSISYRETIKYAYSDRIVVEVANQNDWNLEGSRSRGIDTTYGWEADAKSCGKTVGITYHDFITYIVALDKDAVIGSLLISVPDIDAFDVGDIIDLFDSSRTIQANSVVGIVEGRLQLDTPVSKTFATVWGASIRIRSSTFSNEHEHAIIDGQIAQASVSDYVGFGYPLSHNHVLANLLPGVACMKYDGCGRIYAGGASSELLVSTDGGASWGVAVNAGLDGVKGARSVSTSACESISCLAIDATGKVAAGSGCGSVVLQATSADRGGLPIDVPEVEESSSSSSLSSQSSLNSSSSSLSSLSSSSVSSTSSVSSLSSISSSSRSSLSSQSSQSSQSSSSFPVGTFLIVAVGADGNPVDVVFIKGRPTSTTTIQVIDDSGNGVEVFLDGNSSFNNTDMTDTFNFTATESMSGSPIHIVVTNGIASEG